MLIVSLVLCISSSNCEGAIDQNDFNNNVSVQNHGSSVDLSLCDLYKNPEQFANGTVQVRSALYRTAGITTLGDEGCITRHDLVEVTFSPEFEHHACESKDQSQELCAMVNATKEDTDTGEFEIVAILVGRFEPYKARSGFTSDGWRFRFLVEDIKAIEGVRPIKTVRPVK